MALHILGSKDRKLLLLPHTGWYKNLLPGKLTGPFTANVKIENLRTEFTLVLLDPIRGKNLMIGFSGA